MPGFAKDKAPVVDDVGPVVSRHDEDVFGYAIQSAELRLVAETIKRNAAAMGLING